MCFHKTRERTKKEEELGSGDGTVNRENWQKEIPEQHLCARFRKASGPERGRKTDVCGKDVAREKMELIS